MIDDLKDRGSRTPMTGEILTQGQRSLWFVEQQVHDRSPYLIARAFRVAASLDPERLRAALRIIGRRHSALRMGLGSTGGRPSRVVGEELEPDLTVVDAQDWSGEVLETELTDEASRPFDHQRPPLWRVRLYLLPDSSRVVLFVFDHLIADLWSLGILLHELDRFYRDGSAELARSPGDDEWAEREAEYLAGARAADDGTFWSSVLAEPRATLTLRTDRLRSTTPSLVGASIATTLAPEVWPALCAFGRRHSATPFATLYAAFAAFLSRLSGQTDIIIGAPFANRRSRRAMLTVGYLANLLPLRIDVEANVRFDDLVRRAGQTVRDAAAHQAYPLPSIVERVVRERDAGRAPLFDVVLAFESTRTAAGPIGAALAVECDGVAVEIGGLEWVSMRLPCVAAQRDLTLVAAEIGDQLALDWRYDARLFDAVTIERMAHQFATFTAGLVAEPGCLVSRVALLDPSERDAVLREWNQTRVEAAAGTLHGLVETQAARTPHAPAVVDIAERLSYAELDERANRIARALVHAGVRPHDRVAVVVPRTAWQVASLLAVQKTGAAYVPIDTRLPVARVEQVLDLAGARVAVVVGDTPPPLPRTVRVVSADVDAAAESAAPLAIPVDTRDVAYVILTSGSTGVPKAVMVEHGGVVGTIVDLNRRFAAGPDWRHLALASISFDFSVYEIYAPLAAGGVLVLTEQSPGPDPARWLEWIEREQVTAWSTVPALLTLLLDRVGPGAQLSSLRRVLLAGDWIPLSLVPRIRAVAPRAHVTGGGGVTEASVLTTTFEIEEVASEWRSIPYGRPMTNQEIYVLDHRLEPCPIGVTGELYIGGGGVAIGYWGDPRTTAAAFIPDPHSGRAGSRLYRTGDYGSYLPDGTIEFLGRRDGQVKVRGYRIELGEIEAVVRAHPGVRDAAIVVREDNPGDRRLVAYVVAEHASGAVASPGESLAAALRLHLERCLPEYMVPTAFVELAALPLSANGKLARNQLPAPAARDSGAPVTPPSTPTERVIAEVWRMLLPGRAIDVHTNVFELGAHSLLVAQAQHELEDRLARKVSIADLFRHATIAALARHLDDDQLDTPIESGHVRAVARRNARNRQSRRERGGA